MEAYERLEKELADWCGVENVVVCPSGTAALHLALEVLRLNRARASVLIPDFTMIACARACTLAGLRVRVADCGDDLLIDLPPLSPFWSDIAVIMPVHIYGRQCDMDKISTRARELDIYVIEDLAEAHGVKPHPDSYAACWSFYKNKIVAGEEGGAIAFKEKSDAEYARKLRCLGFTEEHNFVHLPRGHNYRLANSLAEQILQSLSQFDYNVSRRNMLISEYNQHIPDEWKLPPRKAPWVYDLRIPGLTKLQQNRIIGALQAEGLQARHGFFPISAQPEYGSRLCCGHHLRPSRALAASKEVLYFPLNPSGTQERIVQNCRLFREVTTETLTPSPWD